MSITNYRYDLLQQLSVPNAQYAQKFLLALSLDPTAEAKMLRERSQAARQQVWPFNIMLLRSFSLFLFPFPSLPLSPTPLTCSISANAEQRARSAAKVSLKLGASEHNLMLTNVQDHSRTPSGSIAVAILLVP